MHLHLSITSKRIKLQMWDCAQKKALEKSFKSVTNKSCPEWTKGAKIGYRKSCVFLNSGSIWIQRRVVMRISPFDGVEDVIEESLTSLQLVRQVLLHRAKPFRSRALIQPEERDPWRRRCHRLSIVVVNVLRRHIHKFAVGSVEKMWRRHETSL